MNIKSVHAVQGIGHSGLSQMCAPMDLPQPVTFNSYNSILQHVSCNAVELAEQIMHEAAVRLVAVTKEENLEKFIGSPFGKLAHVALTVDGTWQRQ